MKLHFTGELAGLESGIQQLAGDLGYQITDDGMPVRVERIAGHLEACCEEGQGRIRFQEKIHFFRALGLFIEAVRARGGNAVFLLTEEPQFKTNGALFDVSRNAVLTVESCKFVLRKIAVMGLNAVMLYMEDTFDLASQPYFGYMRSRYSYEELQEVDDYADEFGIELFPHIQALGHLSQALKWNYAEDFTDTQDILLAGSEKTYEFVEDMIRSTTAPLRSKRIHLGVDEAHLVGLGKYLQLHGYRNRFEIVSEHLEKVVQIAAKHGLQPMISSDMFFRLGSKTGDYYDLDAVIPEDSIKRIPAGLQLVYWDYYHTEQTVYEQFIREHKKFGSVPIFFSGIWTWNGVAPNYGKTFVTTNAAMNACKKEGIHEVFATLWGDNGAETNVLTGLLGLQLFAEHGYAKELDEEKLKQRFRFCTGADYDAFIELGNLDGIPGAEKYEYTGNPSKFLLWQDILLGLFDKHAAGRNLSQYYLELEQKMQAHREHNPDWNFIFDFYEKLCAVLSVKADLGILIKENYDMNNISRLEQIAEEQLPELSKKMNALRNAHRKQWYAICKPIGWEVIDLRYGGALARIDTAIQRISDFLAGRISRIEELEEARLYFDGPRNLEDESIGNCNLYHRIATASPIGFLT